MLMRKIHRQPAAETSSPPTISPSVPAAADTPPEFATQPKLTDSGRN